MTKVLIINGGNIKRNRSISSANNIYKEIINSPYKNLSVKMASIDEDNNWYCLAIPTNPYKILPHYDIVIDTTYHDNSHHYIANRMGIVNLINREQHQGFIRRAIAQLGVKIQDYKLIKRGEHCNDLYFANLKDKIHREMNLPIMVKSAYKKLPTLIEYKHDEIIDYIKDIHKRDDCIIEEFVRGKNYTVIAIKNIRGESVYLTSVYELIKSEYGRKILVANYLGEEYKSKIREITRNLCSAFDFNIMRIDFVINNNGMKVVNISTNQEYIEGSVLYEIFNLHGISWTEIVLGVNIH